MKYLLIIIGAMLFMVSCTSDNDIQPVKVKRTVFVYMAAENSLTSKISGDIKEMTDGAVSIPANNRMLIFVDKADSQSRLLLPKLLPTSSNPLTRCISTRMTSTRLMQTASGK